MDREENLKKSRAENKNRDMYESEVLRQGYRYTIMVQAVLATVFFVVQIFLGEGINWGLYARVFSVQMTTFWVKLIRMKQKRSLVLAVLYTFLVLAASGSHMYNLVMASTIL